MNNPELAIEYENTGLWLYDIPVLPHNEWCSRCAEKLEAVNTVSFQIERNEKMTLQFEYHKECVIEALNELRNQQIQENTLLKTA
ncbi:MAG: hypothetical protein WDZ80_01875 [Candidatus Paceibacterota bacterium]